jgi:hypothetical protein
VFQQELRRRQPLGRGTLKQPDVLLAIHRSFHKHQPIRQQQHLNASGTQNSLFEPEKVRICS